MATLTESLEIRLDEIVKFIELTEGKEGLEALLLSENVFGAIEKHKLAYESFVGKYLNADKEVHEATKLQAMTNVYTKILIVDTNNKIKNLFK